MLSNHLILYQPFLLLLSIFPSFRVFSNESAPHIRGPKYWIFNFSISPSNEYSGLISFRIDLFHLFAVQGTLKSLLQHHHSEASILRALSLLEGPTFTSIHDYWKNPSFDYSRSNTCFIQGLTRWCAVVKNLAANAGDTRDTRWV